MSPVTHFLVSWSVACAAPLERRGRMLVTLAGVAPDLDGVGIIPELATRGSAHPLLWFSDYHHVLGHNLGLALLTTAVCALLARRKFLTAAFGLLTFHLHLFCDLVGARGPDGYQWPIPYLLPFSHALKLTWHGQWALNAWPNFVVTGAALVLAFYLAWLRGFSPLEMISSRADKVFVEALRRRFPRHRTMAAKTA